MKILILVILVNVLWSCNQAPRDLEQNTSNSESENLVKANKYLVKTDNQKIDGFVKRHNWQMEITSTGLRYMIYKKGNGKKVQTGNRVSLTYTVSLLDGTTCYTYDSTQVKSFVVGKGGVERGLEEGVLYMHIGDKARFIMMPHLAFGLIGDQNCIPARATVIYDVELVNISN